MLMKLYRIAKEFKGNAYNIADVYFEDNSTLISIGQDKVIRYWNINTGKELYAKAIFDDGEWVIFTPEGYFDTSENGSKHLNILTSFAQSTPQVMYPLGFFSHFLCPPRYALYLGHKSVEKTWSITYGTDLTLG